MDTSTHTPATVSFPHSHSYYYSNYHSNNISAPNLSLYATHIPPMTSTQHGRVTGQVFLGNLYIVQIGQAPPPPQCHDEGFLHPTGGSCRSCTNPETVAAVLGRIDPRLSQRPPHFSNESLTRLKPSSFKYKPHHSHHLSSQAH